MKTPKELPTPQDRRASPEGSTFGARPTSPSGDVLTLKMAKCFGWTKALGNFGVGHQRSQDSPMDAEIVKKWIVNLKYIMVVLLHRAA